MEFCYLIILAKWKTVTIPQKSILLRKWWMLVKTVQNEDCIIADTFKAFEKYLIILDESLAMSQFKLIRNHQECVEYLWYEKRKNKFKSWDVPFKSIQRNWCNLNKMKGKKFCQKCQKKYCCYVLMLKIKKEIKDLQSD